LSIVLGDIFCYERHAFRVWREEEKKEGSKEGGGTGGWMTEEKDTAGRPVVRRGRTDRTR
jgi:hypothetical protein